jgi:hypothetical protein
MKECVECGKNLGIIGGYRHPILGKDALVCSHCFDTVFENVEEYRKFISPYIRYFSKETSIIDDLHKIGKNVTKNIKKMQHKATKVWFHNINQNTNETLSIVN